MVKRPIIPPLVSQLLSDSRGRQLAAWAIAVALALAVSAFGRQIQVEPTVIVQLGWLFIVDSAIFLALYRDYPKLGVVMITFMYFLELSVLGYFVLAGASFSA